MKDELRSLSLAVILSFIAIYTVNYFFNPQTVDVSKQVLEVEQASEELNKTAKTLTDWWSFGATVFAGVLTAIVTYGAVWYTNKKTIEFKNSLLKKSHILQTSSIFSF